MALNEQKLGIYLLGALRFVSLYYLFVSSDTEFGVVEETLGDMSAHVYVGTNTLTNHTQNKPYARADAGTAAKPELWL